MDGVRDHTHGSYIAAEIMGTPAILIRQWHDDDLFWAPTRRSARCVFQLESGVGRRGVVGERKDGKVNRMVH